MKTTESSPKYLDFVDAPTFDIDDPGRYTAQLKRAGYSYIPSNKGVINFGGFQSLRVPNVGPIYGKTWNGILTEVRIVRVHEPPLGESGKVVRHLNVKVLSRITKRLKQLESELKKTRRKDKKSNENYERYMSRIAEGNLVGGFVREAEPAKEIRIRLDTELAKCRPLVGVLCERINGRWVLPIENLFPIDESNTALIRFLSIFQRASGLLQYTPSRNPIGKGQLSAKESKFITQYAKRVAQAIHEARQTENEEDYAEIAKRYHLRLDDLWKYVETDQRPSRIGQAAAYKKIRPTKK